MLKHKSGARNLISCDMKIFLTCWKTDCFMVYSVLCSVFGFLKKLLLLKKIQFTKNSKRNYEKLSLSRNKYLKYAS